MFSRRNQVVSERSESARAIACAGLLALAVAMGIGRFAFTPILPMMQEDAGLSVPESGWLASANYLGYLLGALSAVAMRVQPAVAIRAGLIVIALVTAVMGFGERFAFWLVLRALAGIASAWVLIFVSAWCLEKLAHLNQSGLNRVVFAGVGAGITGAGALCLALMHLNASSAQAWIVFGILSLGLSFVLWPAFGSPSAMSDSRRAETPGSLTGESIRLVLCYGAFGFGYIIPATFLPVMAKHAIHDPWLFGWVWPIFGLAAVASTVATGILPKSIGNRGLWQVSHLVMALGVALPVFLPGILGILLAALFVGGTFMVATMAAMREAQEVAGRQATRLIAAMTSAFAVGQIAGPISVSYVAGVDGNLSVSLLIACFFLTISAYALSRRPRKEKSHETLS